MARPDGRVTLYPGKGGGAEKPVEFRLAGGPVESLAVSPDGRLVAAGDRDGPRVTFLDAVGAPPVKASGHVGPVSSLAFDRGGSRLASGGADQAVRVWDVAGRGRAPVGGQGGRVVAGAAFDAEGRTLVGGGETIVVVWSVESGAQLGTFRGFNAPVNSVAVRGDGKVLATGYGRVVALWDLPRQAAQRRPSGPSITACGWSRPARQARAQGRLGARWGTTSAAGRP
ncbi:MAG: hypothetical protein U0835_05290 [Isosphaeraceae bacterium]